MNGTINVLFICFSPISELSLEAERAGAAAATACTAAAAERRDYFLPSYLHWA
jgi:hypothetical protein